MDWDIKSNRIVYYQNERFNVCELYDRLREEGRFVDVVVSGEFYSACRVNCYVYEVGEVCVLINVKAGTRDVHFLCSDLVELSVFELVDWRLSVMLLRRLINKLRHWGLGVKIPA